jgi:hypothetical protein
MRRVAATAQDLVELRRPRRQRALQATGAVGFAALGLVLAITDEPSALAAVPVGLVLLLVPSGPPSWSIGGAASSR